MSELKEAEPGLDGLVRVAASIANAPSATVTMIDEHRQWFAAAVGPTAGGGGPGGVDEQSLACGRQVVETGAPVIVTGEQQAHFFAGFPLTTPSGEVLGALCLSDREPRELSDEQFELLGLVADQVMLQLNLRRALSGREQEVNAQEVLRAATSEAMVRGKQLEEAQEIAELGSWSVDLVTGASWWSPQLFRLFGADPESVTPAMETARMFNHPEDRERVREATERIRNGGLAEQVEYRIVRADGEERIVLARGRCETGAEGQALRIVGTIQDITGLRHTERELRRAEQERDAQRHMLRAVIQNNQSIIVVKDLEGQYLMINEAFEKVFGVGEDEILGTTGTGLDPGLAERWQANDQRSLAGEPVHFDEIVDLPDGRHWFETVKIPLSDASGLTYAVCTVALDVTERRRAEAEKTAAMEAMTVARDTAIAATKAKSAFLATMSHEIRTPMNAVIGMSGLLLDTPLNDEQVELLQTVIGSGDQLLAIINDILDFSKIEAGDLDLEVQPFELRDCVEGAVAQFAGSAKNLDLVSHVDDDCPVMVVGDVTRLRQVLTNLVGNAIKFTMQGDVLLRVQLEPDPAPGVRLRFTVTDTGIGISGENMGRLFKSFSQVDASTTRLYGGTGLGLAISKAIVEAMSGKLSVTSQVGVGSAFTFVVDLGRFDGPQTRHPRPPARVAGRHVLIVDDNDTNRRVLRLQLESYGMLCQDSSSSLGALALIGGGARFDLAILDYAMPVMDGVQLALALRQLPCGQDLPFVLLSSIGRRDRTHEDVFASVLTKPTRSAALAEVLGQVLAPEAAPPESADAQGPAAAPEAAAVGPGVASIPRPADGRLAPRDRDLLASGPLHILLVEDNEINQKVGRLMLAKLGHTVDLAANGVEAVQALERHDYEVVLMDMHMPVMDGLEATRTIRAQIPAERQPHIIAMTASVTREDRDACAAAGMDNYLAKPVRADDLTRALGAIPVRR